MKKRPQPASAKPKPTPSTLTGRDLKRLAQQELHYGAQRQRAREAMGRSVFEQARKDGTSAGALSKLEKS